MNLRESPAKETNPFKLFGTKEVWDKIQEQSKNNQPVRFPGIGIEQTPVYQLQKQSEDKNISKKQDFLTKLRKFEYAQTGNQRRLDILGMKYEEIGNMKKYQSRMERLDPVNKNLLSHKLNKAVEQAAFLWGGRDQMRLDPSMISFEKSMNEILNQSQKPQLMQIKSHQALRGKFFFTKGHCKIKLAHEI